MYWSFFIFFFSILFINYLMDDLQIGLGRKVQHECRLCIIMIDAATNKVEYGSLKFWPKARVPQKLIQNPDNSRQLAAYHFSAALAYSTRYTAVWFSKQPTVFTRS